MWFLLSLVAMLCWSGSDLFSKIGCQYEDDKYNHLKMIIAVGVVMGLHAAYEVFLNGVHPLSQDLLLGLDEGFEVRQPFKDVRYASPDDAYGDEAERQSPYGSRR